MIPLAQAHADRAILRVWAEIDFHRHRQHIEAIKRAQAWCAMWVERLGR